MAHILILYGTVQGQTEKIAQTIGQELSNLGQLVTLLNSKNGKNIPSLANYDGVIVGGGVHASGFPRSLKKWVTLHSKELASKPTAFFSVCLGILQKDPKVQEAERKIVEDFFETTGWRPTEYFIFAGALPYSKYNWFLKRIMHHISKKAGFEGRMTQDYEFTDWAQVKNFTQRYASKLSR